LDGNWTNGGPNTESGNGNIVEAAALNNFSFRMAFLPGDANLVQNYVVNSTDSSRVMMKQNEYFIPALTPPASPGYDPKSDLDGSAIINSFDQFSTLSRQNSFLLPAPGPSMSFNLVGNKSTSDRDSLLASSNMIEELTVEDDFGFETVQTMDNLEETSVSADGVADGSSESDSLDEVMSLFGQDSEEGFFELI
ncbi:MAG: hypothetical protein ABL921_35280, partial [Pirellula sp.]